MLSELGYLTEDFIAASGEFKTSVDDSAIVTPGQSEYTGNDWASRRISVWDDED